MCAYHPPCHAKEVKVDGSRRSPGFTSEDGQHENASHPDSSAAFPGNSQWPRAMSSLTVARQRGICTRFPVFAERRKRAFLRLQRAELLNDECNGRGGGSQMVGAAQAAREACEGDGMLMRTLVED